MKKLLVLALLGLVLGGGVWKLQNPQGTVDDLRTQAEGVAARLNTGIQAGVQSISGTETATAGQSSQQQQALLTRLEGLEANTAEQQAISDRLASLETSLSAQQAAAESTASDVDTNGDLTDLTARLAQLEDSLSSQQAMTARLEDLEKRLSEYAEAASTDNQSGEELAAISSLVSGSETRLNTVDQRLSAQDEALTAANSSVEQVREELASVGTSVRDISAGNDAGIVRLDAIDSRLDLLVRRLDEQTTVADLKSINDNVNSISTQLSSLADDQTALEKSVSENVSEMNDRADALSLRLNTLASQNRSQIENPETSGDDTSASDGSSNQSAEDTVQAVSAFNAGLDERFSAIESRLTTVNSDSRRISTLNEQLEAARKKITQLEARDALTLQSFEEINGSISELKTASDSLSIDTVQAEVRDQLALVQAQLESNIEANNTDALEELLDSTRGQIQSLEQRVLELPAASSEADNAQQIQSALESQIAALERRLETASNADPALISKLSTVKEQVDQLAAKGFITQDDLRARQEGKAVEYKIYFDRNSAEVTEDAAKVLSSFIAQEKNRTTGVSIFGFTDRRGPAIYNQQLALQRATNVRSFLIQNGLDYTKIKTISGLGEDAAAAVLPDNADDAQQRVVVLYAAQQ
ncbi:MAG: OmpA family protein [Granulosicoccus sp.]